MHAIFDQGPPPSCPAPFNMAQYVLAAGAETPDKIALAVLTQTGAQRWSYDRLTRAVLGTATGLARHGARPGDRVLMQLGDSVEFPITYLAALAAGLIPVPTSAMLTGPEVSGIAAETRPALIVAQSGVALPDHVDCPVIGAADLAQMHALPAADFVMGDPDRPGYIIYTSGTSGVPRAVTHAHRAIWARRMMWQGWYGLTPQDRLLHAGAFNWTYTLGTGLLDPWTIGATALIPGAGVTPAQLPLLLRRHDATIFAAAPGVYRQVLRHDMPPLPKLRHGLSAGEKLPASTRAAWVRATGTPIHEAYGMSECSTFISGAPDRPAPEGKLGYPQTGRCVAVLDDAGPVAFDQPGTLAIARGDPGLMLGYWDAGKSAPTLSAEPWFRTGDTVSMAVDGSITYLGRGDDMMNAGGVRVSPIEVETALNAHPGITECAAVEVPVKADVSVIAAFYVAEAELDPDALRAFAAGSLAKYKQPRIYRRVDALPKGANGKLLRRQLRDTWAAEPPDG
ncbi:MAG: acyl--CoA ligase [Rhodobacter sp.]|nr:acyl--CoA ligase [Rhodobacter sp.]